MCAAIVAAGLAKWPARAETEASRHSVTLEVGAGSTVMLERPFKTVLIGNPDVIDVQTQDERSVLLKPLSAGATNLVFIDEQGMVIANLAVLVRSARSI
jgi:Flp pilus assembly secretin CpaC